MATTVPAAKRAIVDRLKARPGLDRVIVQIGLPAEAPARKERIYLTGTEAFERDYLLQQRGWRETYLLPVIIEVEKTGTASARDQVELRAWEILDELQAVIDADPAFEGILDESEIESVPSEITLPLHTDDGWLTRITVQIRALGMVI